MTRDEIETKVCELYIGILGRAPDSAGLRYWADEIEYGRLTLENTRAAFATQDQAEYWEIYGNLSSDQLVTKVYNNFLEREPDHDGLQYWIGELDGGRVNPDQVVNAIINAVQSPVSKSEQTQTDVSVLSNKVSAGLYFARGAGVVPEMDSDFVARAKSVVSDVSADINSLNLAKASVDTYFKAFLEEAANSRPASINLADLNGKGGVLLTSAQAQGKLGGSINEAGDINGDGYGDLIIGADHAHGVNSYYGGKSFLVFGGANSWGGSLDLSSLNGANGVGISGAASFDFSGGAVAGAGDVNGDGFDDFLLSSRRVDPSANEDSGNAYLIFGKARGWDGSLDLASLNGGNGVVINGENSGDSFGYSLSGIGDLNGDGIEDILIGAYRADPDGKESAGKSYVIFGRTSGWDTTFNLSELDGNNGFSISGGDWRDFIGFAVDGIGDVNGDGFADILIGASGVDPIDPFATPELGETVRVSDGVGGYQEVFFPFPEPRPVVKEDAGASYLVFGKATGWAADLNVASLDGQSGTVINGVDKFDSSGSSVSGVGDVNRDGYDDFLIGANGADVNGQSGVGEVYLVFGHADGWGQSLELAALDGSNGVVFTGIDALDYAGRHVSGAGDVNGDGYADFLIAAPEADPNGVDGAGESYLVYGKGQGWDAVFDLSSLDGRDGIVINGIDAGDYSGSAISGAGDVNGDGKSDLLVGASLADKNDDYQSRGEAYLLFGGDLMFGL